MKGELRESTPKYETVTAAVSELTGAGFELKGIKTTGESSLQNWILAYNKEYEDIDTFVSNAHEDYWKDNYANIDGGGPELDWKDTSFELAKGDCSVVITIAGGNGSAEPVKAPYAIEAPAGDPDAGKAQAILKNYV